MSPADEKTIRNPRRACPKSQAGLSEIPNTPPSFDSRTIFRPIVPVYDLLNRILSMGRDQVWRRRAARHVDSGVVLDLACGTGDLAAAVARRPGTHVFGSDILPEMLTAARKKRIFSASRLIPLTCAAGERLPFRSSSFDAITIAFGIRNFADRCAGLREMRRTLRATGRALILEFALPEHVLFRSIYLFYFLRVLPAFGALISRDNRSYAYLPESVLKFPEPLAFADEIRAAGFSEVSIESYSLGIVRLYIAQA